MEKIEVTEDITIDENNPMEEQDIFQYFFYERND